MNIMLLCRADIIILYLSPETYLKVCIHCKYPCPIKHQFQYKYTLGVECIPGCSTSVAGGGAKKGGGLCGPCTPPLRIRLLL